MATTTGNPINILTLLAQSSPRIKKDAESPPPVRPRTRGRGKLHRPEGGWTPPSSNYWAQVNSSLADTEASVPDTVAGAVEYIRKPAGLDKLWVATALKCVCVTSLADIEKETTFTVNVGKGSTIGLQWLVETSKADAGEIRYSMLRDSKGDIIYGPNGKDKYYRLVGGRLPSDTDQITVVLQYDEGILYVRDYYYGVAIRPFPGCGGTVDDIRWWQDPETGTGHALAVTKEVLDQGLIVKLQRECPWLK